MLFSIDHSSSVFLIFLFQAYAVKPFLPPLLRGQLEFQFLTHIYHLNGNIIHGFRKLHKFFPEKFPLRFPDKTLAPCVLKSGQIVRQRGGSAFSAHRRGEELMKKSGSQQLLAKQRLPRASVRLHGLGECLLLLGSGFLTAGAQIGGLALPLGACLTASLPFGRRSLSAALGAAHDPSHNAMDDILATADALAALIERIAGHVEANGK